MEGGGGRIGSFAQYLHAFTNKKGTSLRVTALVACPVHLLLSNVSISYQRRFIENKHVVVGFLPM